jgi:hypothetical protein
VLSPGVQRPGREVNHSSASSALVKMIGAVPLRPLYAFMYWTGVTLHFLRYVTLFRLGHIRLCYVTLNLLVCLWLSCLCRILVH